MRRGLILLTLGWLGTSLGCAAPIGPTSLRTVSAEILEKRQALGWLDAPTKPLDELRQIALLAESIGNVSEASNATLKYVQRVRGTYAARVVEARPGPDVAAAITFGLRMAERLRRPKLARAVLNGQDPPKAAREIVVRIRAAAPGLFPQRDSQPLPEYAEQVAALEVAIASAQPVEATRIATELVAADGRCLPAVAWLAAQREATQGRLPVRYAAPAAGLARVARMELAVAAGYDGPMVKALLADAYRQADMVVHAGIAARAVSQGGEPAALASLVAGMTRLSLDRDASALPPDWPESIWLTGRVLALGSGPERSRAAHRALLRQDTFLRGEQSQYEPHLSVLLDWAMASGDRATLVSWVVEGSREVWRWCVREKVSRTRCQKRLEDADRLHTGQWGDDAAAFYAPFVGLPDVDAEWLRPAEYLNRKGLLALSEKLEPLRGSRVEATEAWARLALVSAVATGDARAIRLQLAQSGAAPPDLRLWARLAAESLSDNTIDQLLTTRSEFQPFEGRRVEERAWEDPEMDGGCGKGLVGEVCLALHWLTWGDEKDARARLSRITKNLPAGLPADELAVLSAAALEGETQVQRWTRDLAASGRPTAAGELAFALARTGGSKEAIVAALRASHEGYQSVADALTSGALSVADITLSVSETPRIAELGEQARLIPWVRFWFHSSSRQQLRAEKVVWKDAAQTELRLLDGLGQTAPEEIRVFLLAAAHRFAEAKQAAAQTLGLRAAALAGAAEKGLLGSRGLKLWFQALDEGKEKPLASWLVEVYRAHPELAP
ncbi:MAG: hypothetical protein ACI9WU_001890, partial [Myxococcota bacterium]